MVGYFGVYRPLTRKRRLTSPRRAFAAALGGYVGHRAAAALRGDRARASSPTLFHSANGPAPVRAVPPGPDHPGHAARPPDRGRGRRVRAHRRRHRSTCSGPTCRSCGSTTTPCPRPTPSWPPHRHGSSWWYGAGADRADGRGHPARAAATLGRLRRGQPRRPIRRLPAEEPPVGVPSGLHHYAEFWHHALFDGYDFSHDPHPSVGYVISALFGAAVISAGAARHLRHRSGWFADAAAIRPTTKTCRRRVEPSAHE